MKRTRIHPSATHSTRSRPFFSKGVQRKDAAPFFSVQQSASVTKVQPQREADAQQEEDLPQQTNDFDGETEPSVADDSPLPPTEPDTIPIIQAKLTIGQPDDVYEQEADRVATQIMQIEPVDHQTTPEIHRETEPEQIEQLKEEKIQTQRSSSPSGGELSTASSALEARLDSKQSGGQPLPETTRNFMESQFGESFQQVRVHTDTDADQLNQSLNAQAFTHGHHLFFGAGKYQPESSEGKQLLAHELTHVIQQTGSHTLNETSSNHIDQSIQKSSNKFNNSQADSKLIQNRTDLEIIQRNNPDQPSNAPLLSQNQIPTDSGIPDDTTTSAQIVWPQAQNLNLQWWQRLNLIEVMPIHSYDPVHQPKAWANKIFAAQEMMRNAGIRHVQNRRLVVDGVIGPRTFLAIQQVAQTANHPAQTPLQSLGFNLDAIAHAESAALAALAIARPAEFLLEWNFNSLGERAVRYYDLNFGMVISDRELIDSLLFGNQIPEGIRREDRIELLRRMYGREGRRLQGRAALIHAERSFIHTRIDIQRVVERDRNAPSGSAFFRFVGDNQARASIMFQLFEQNDAFSAAYRAAPAAQQTTIDEALTLLRPPATGAPPQQERTAFIFLIYLPVLDDSERTAVVSQYLVEKTQREQEEEALRQSHNREAARQRADALVRVMDDDQTSRLVRQFRFEDLLRRELPDKRHFELVIDDLVGRQPNQYVRLFDVLDDLGAVTSQGILVELSLAGRYANHSRVQSLITTLNQQRVEYQRHRYITGDDPHVLLDSDQRLSIGQVAGDVSSIYYRDETRERLKPASEERLNAELEIQARIYFENLANGREAERSTDEIGELLLQRAWQAAGMSQDRDIEEVEIRESFRLMGLREAPSQDDGIQRWEVEYQKVTRVIGDNFDTGWQNDSTSRAWRSDSQFGNDLFWLSYSQTADIIQTAAIVVSVAAVVVIAWEVGAIAALVRAAGGATQVVVSIALSEAFYLLTHERWTLHGLLVAGIEGYLGALGFKAFAPVGAAVAGRIGTATFRQLVARWLVRHGTTGALTGVTTGPAGLFADDLIRIAQQGGGRFSGLERYLLSAALGLVIGAVAEIGGSAILSPIFRTADKTALNSLDEVVAQAVDASVTPTQWTAELAGALSNTRVWAHKVLDDAIANGMMVTIRQRVLQAVQHYRTGWQITILRQVIEMTDQPLSRQGVEGLEILLRHTQGHLSNDAMLGLLRHVALEPARISPWLSFIRGLDENLVRSWATGGQLRQLANSPATLALATRRSVAEVSGLLSQRFNQVITDLEAFSTRLNALDETVANQVLELLRTRGTSVTPATLLRIAETTTGLEDDVVAGLIRLMQRADRTSAEALVIALPADGVAPYLNRIRTVPQSELETVAGLLNDFNPTTVAWAAPLPIPQANTLLRGLSADARTAIANITAHQAQSLSDLLGLNVLNDALTNGAAHNIRGSHLQALRNHFNDATVQDFVTWASSAPNRMRRVVEVGGHVQAAATRLPPGGRLASNTLVLDSNAMFAIEELMRGTPFASLTPNRQDAINGIRNSRHLGGYTDPPTGTLPSLDHIVGPGADLRSPLAVATEAVRGEAHLGTSPVLDRLTGLNVARSHPDYNRVLAELGGARSVGGSKGALDRSVVADAMFADTPAGVTPTLVTTDQDVVLRLATHFAVPTRFTPAPKAGSSWAQFTANPAFSGRRFTIDILGHRLSIVF